MKSKVIIAGGTGFLGQSIVKEFSLGKKYDVVVLTRGESLSVDGVAYIHWDGVNEGDWSNHLKDAYAIINLSGKSVNCLYTASNKKEIIDSRVKSTLALGNAILKLQSPPKVWINISSVAIFGNGGDITKDELSFTGNGFPSEVCQLWEHAFNSIHLPQTRKVIFRLGLVFQKATGLLMPFVTLTRLGLGGTIGSGAQYISWIHEKDFLRLLEYIIQHDQISGIFHGVSPNPVTNEHFMKLLRETLGVKFYVSHPALFVRLGATLFGTEPELLLYGRRVVSRKVLHTEFDFTFPHLKDALEDLLNVRPNEK